MSRPRVTINASMFTASIGVDAECERNVGAVILSENGTRSVAIVDSFYAVRIRGFRIPGHVVHMESFKPVSRIKRRTPSLNSLGHLELSNKNDDYDRMSTKH